MNHDTLDETITERNFQAALYHENLAISYERGARVSTCVVGPNIPANLRSIALTHRALAETRLFRAIHNMP